MVGFSYTLAAIGCDMASAIATDNSFMYFIITAFDFSSANNIHISARLFVPNTPHVRPNHRHWLAKIAIIREKHVGEEEETQGKVYHRTITVIQEGQMSGGDSGTAGSGGGTGNGDSKCSICNGTGRCTGTYCYKGSCSRCGGTGMGTMGIKARCGLPCHFSRGVGQTAVWIEALGIVVVVERCPHTHVVVFGKVCFEHQLGISVLLYDIILSLPERVVGIYATSRAASRQWMCCVRYQA